jgi:ABC-2 type transport system permease protein
MMALTIAGRELRALFLSPLAWTVLAVVAFIGAWIFLSLVDLFLTYQGEIALADDAPGLTQIVAAQLFNNIAFVLLLVTPLLTMRLVSEELRSQTISLLFSAPVSMTQIVLGKYLGALGFFAVLLGIVVLMPLSLLVGATLDAGHLAAAVLGLALLTASLTAAGLFVSTLTAQPTVAGVASFGLLLLLWIIDWAGSVDPAASGLFAYLSLSRHHEALLQGVFDTRDVAYYLLFIATFLVLSIRRLDAYRLEH